MLNSVQRAPHLKWKQVKLIPGIVGHWPDICHTLWHSYQNACRWPGPVHVAGKALEAHIKEQILDLNSHKSRDYHFGQALSGSVFLLIR